MKNSKLKTKIIALLAVSLAVFATTFFALAQSQNNNSLFLDSDQDGLTDQEEKMIGTDPFKADTDGDGYSDGKEVESGYNPLKPAPGDQLVPDAKTSSSPASSQTSNASSAVTTTSPADSVPTTEDSVNIGQTDPANAALLAQSGQNDVLGTDGAADLTSDPNNPNLTNEMVGQLLQLTKDKATSDSSFADNPTFSSADLSQVTQGALQTADITKDLPEIKDSDINLLPAIDDKKLSADDIKAKQKAEIEKYLSQTAFILASNSPFPVENTNDLSPNLTAESTNIITALNTGDASKLDTYAQKAQAGIDQLKKVEVPYILKDVHKSVLQLSLYTLNLKNNLTFNATDPMKSLVAVSSLQSIAQSATQVQQQLSQILTSYGIDAIKFP